MSPEVRARTNENTLEKESNAQSWSGTRQADAFFSSRRLQTDYTPRESYSQYMLRYHEPEEDTNPVDFRSKRGDFSEYIDKAIQLKVNLKSTAH